MTVSYAIALKDRVTARFFFMLSRSHIKYAGSILTEPEDAENSAANMNCYKLAIHLPNFAEKLKTL